MTEKLKNKLRKINFKKTRIREYRNKKMLKLRKKINNKKKRKRNKRKKNIIKN